ncbi:hypothetical protein KY308_01950 [Candidatus Woesearchaeota archaeon]|nr:hypothetical protein [Candidatus Woesearchaeota archaeon]
MKRKTKKTIDRLIRIGITILCIYLGYTRNVWFYVLAVLAFITAIKGQQWLYDFFRPKIKQK